jgi:hypothetical protein
METDSIIQRHTKKKKKERKKERERERDKKEDVRVGIRWVIVSDPLNRLPHYVWITHLPPEKILSAAPRETQRTHTERGREIER